MEGNRRVADEEGRCRWSDDEMTDATQGAYDHVEDLAAREGFIAAGQQLARRGGCVALLREAPFRRQKAPRYERGGDVLSNACRWLAADEGERLMTIQLRAQQRKALCRRSMSFSSPSFLSARPLDRPLTARPLPRPSPSPPVPVPARPLSRSSLLVRPLVRPLPRPSL